MQSRPNVLLIEDDPAQAYVLTHAVREARPSAGVHAVASATEAEQFLYDASAGAARTRELRLIVLDLMLPDRNGLELLRQLKQHPLTRRIPVLVLTVEGDPGRVVESYGLQANSYVVKRPEPEFGRAVEEIVRYWLELNEPPAATLLSP